MPRWISRIVWPVDRWLAANLTSAPDADEVVVKTSRYLRLAMIGMVVGLAASVLFEILRVRHQTGKGCLLGSISAYYYTPTHAFFVGTLVTIGVCLVALRGNTDLEDLLLNFAGTCAPIVALVPTPGAPTGCGATLGVTDRNLNIANNVGALLLVGFLALVFVAVQGWLSLRGSDPATRPSWIDRIGYAVTVAFFLATLLSFWQHRTWFVEFAHPIAALSMFVLIGLNVFLNGYNLYQTRKQLALRDPSVTKVPPVNRYVVLGILMALAGLASVLVVREYWGQWVFGLEASEIGLFGVFWVMQTFELRNSGLRPTLASAVPPIAAGEPA